MVTFIGSIEALHWALEYMKGISTTNDLWRERHRTEWVVLVSWFDIALRFGWLLLLLSRPFSRLGDGVVDGFANEIDELLRLLFEVVVSQFNYDVLGKAVDTTAILYTKELEA